MLHLFFKTSVAIICALHASIAITAESSRRADKIKSAVVKITVTQRSPDFFRPWSKGYPTEASGTGFVIEGNRIITNAHVVQYASSIYIQLHGSDERLEAHVEVASYELDLALVRLDDPTPLDSVAPLEIDESLTPLRSEVNVYGFPIGGDQLSITQGIVSRIEFATIAMGQSGLRVQVDAAINPGNSGGPAVWNDKVVGVVYSYRIANNIGYLIHAQELSAFLKDVEDGKYDGSPRLMATFQKLENSALRSKLHLPKSTGGILVSHLNDGVAESYPLKSGDVVTQIGSYPVDSQGRVQVDDLQLHFEYYCRSLCVDGCVPLTVWRGQEEIHVRCPAPRESHFVIPFLKGRHPSYFIVGPMTFVAANAEMSLSLIANPEWFVPLTARGSPIVSNLFRQTKSTDEQFVIVSNMPFSHRLMKGYDPPVMNCVKSINEIRVKNLVHLVELIRDSHDDYLEFDFHDRDSERLVFKRQELIDSTPSILEDNNIREQFSSELRDVWNRR